MNKSLKRYISLSKVRNLSAVNSVSTFNPAVCLNFIQVENTEVSLMTVTIMKNKRKCIALNPVSFLLLLNKIEGCLELIDSLYEVNKPPLFSSIYEDTRHDTKWYKLMKCHRAFFIPTVMIFDVLERLSSESFVKFVVMNCEIEELSFRIDTDYNQLLVVKSLKKEV